MTRDDQARELIKERDDPEHYMRSSKESIADRDYAVLDAELREVNLAIARLPD